MPDIMHLLKIEAPREAVYRALTTQDGVRGWWTRDAELDTAEGGTGSFRFYGQDRAHVVRIEALAPPSRVRWRVTSSFMPAWNGTTIAFDPREDAGDTLLAFAHRGFAEADDVYARVTTGWGYFLVSLRQFVETGSGGPAPDVEFARFLGRGRVPASA